MKVSVQSGEEASFPPIVRLRGVHPSTYGDPELKTSRHVPKHETCSRLGDIVHELELVSRTKKKLVRMEIIRCQLDTTGFPYGFPKVGVPVRHVKTNVLGEGIRNAAANVPSKVRLVYRTFGGQSAIC